MIFRPGKRSSVPSKIRCDNAIVVSVGRAIVFVSQPFPFSRLASSGIVCGWMNSTAPNSSALAQTGWKRGSANPAPATLPPIAAPRSPCVFIAVSSCSTARSGNCSANEAKAAKRSGFDAQSSASFSFCTRMISAARSRSLRYQNGLIDSTSISTPCESIAFRRSSSDVVIKACLPASFIGDWKAAVSSPISFSASWNRQWAWTSTVLTRLPLTMTGRRDALPAGCWARAASSNAQLQNTMPAVAAAVFRKCRRLVISPPVLDAAGCHILAGSRHADSAPAPFILQSQFFSRPGETGLTVSGLASAGACRRGRAQVEAVIRRLIGGHLAAGGQNATGMRVVGRTVNRLDADQRAVAVAEHRKRTALGIAAQYGPVVAGRQSGDLQAQLALLAPEPRQRLVGVRLADDPVGNAAGVVGGVLHRFEAGRRAAHLETWKRGAVADCRDRRVRCQQLLIDDNPVADLQPRSGGQLAVRYDPDADQHEIGAEPLAIR